MGVIAASGTITQLIPPSLVLVVLADQLGRSVGDMYAGAIGPSIIQIALFCIWVAIVSIFRPQDVPALPLEARTLRGWALVEEVPARHDPVARPDLPGARHDLHGLGDADRGRRHGRGRRDRAGEFYGTLTWPLLYQGMASTMRITAMVVYILIGARVFSLVFQGVGGKVWIEDMLTSLPGGQVGFLIFVNAFIFVIAFFLDFFEIAFIIIPMLAPAAEQARHRPGLVRRADLRQHPDQLHASAVWLCAVLLARHRTALGQDIGYLLGRHPLGRLQVILVAHRDPVAADRSPIASTPAPTSTRRRSRSTFRADRPAADVRLQVSSRSIKQKAPELAAPGLRFCQFSISRASRGS